LERYLKWEKKIMFDDLLNKIKGKLPDKDKENMPKDEGNNDSEALDTEDKTDPDRSTEDKTAQVNVDDLTQESKTNDLDEKKEGEEESPEELKKQQKSRLIKIIVVGAIVWFGIDTYMQEQEMPKKQGQIQKKTLAKKKVMRKRKMEKKKQALKVREESVIAVPTPVREEIPVPQEPAPVIIKEEIPVPQEPAPVVVEEIPVPQEPAPEIVKEDQLELQLKKIIQEVEDKELVIQKYVKPPSFDDVGRGLVYNCQGRHWACVDRKGYFSCKKNALWAKGNNKNIECHISNVYANIEDCQIMQVHNINTNAKTSFCAN